jgi:Zn-dependent protease with chaperone function
MTPTVVPTGPRIEIERWPTERLLFGLTMLVSLVLWVVAVVTIIGAFYAALFGVFFFFIHLAFIAHVRGSAVRLGPDQFPDLHAAVVRIATRIGLEPVPEVYLMQAGGALNAFATRFLGQHMVVLFSDLLEACGDRTGARDMIIAHELGHVKEGHLRWHWILLPASLIPFLPQALSRAREYTCDRYGLAGAGNTDDALLGLAILSAGAKHGPHVNRRVFVAQRESLNTGWMTIGTWFGSHPPLSHRMMALEPSLAGGARLRPTGVLRAAAIVCLVVLPIFTAAWMGGSRFSSMVKEAQSKVEQNGAQGSGASTRHQRSSRAPAAAREDSMRAVSGLTKLASFLDKEQRNGRGLPANSRELYARWVLGQGDELFPRDPYDTEFFGYTRVGDRYLLWSSGPDGKSETDDDITWPPRSASR